MSDTLIGALIGTLTAILAAITIFRTRADCNSYRDIHVKRQDECWKHIIEKFDSMEDRLSRLESNVNEFIMAQRRAFSGLIVSLPLNDSEKMNLIKVLNGK